MSASGQRSGTARASTAGRAAAAPNIPFAELMGRVRRASGLSINRLARESGISVSNVYKLETAGSLPNRDTTAAIARVLDPRGEHKLMLCRDMEELIRLGYDLRTAHDAATTRLDR